MGPRDSTATRSSVITTPSSAERWRSRLRASTYALYRLLQEDERLAPSIGVEALAELIDEGRALPTAPATLTHVTAEALGGAIFHELRRAAAREGSAPRESELVPMLMYTAVLPYAGVDSAAEEIGIPPPPR